MTQLTALKALAEKVDAGEAEHVDAWGDVLWILHYESAISAYHGSLDAAMILHKAFLSGKYGFSIGPQLVSLPNGFGFKIDVYSILDNPARAWLLAIIRAKVLELESEVTQ